jgi:hypothetical protein
MKMPNYAACINYHSDVTGQSWSQNFPTVELADAELRRFADSARGVMVCEGIGGVMVDHIHAKVEIGQSNDLQGEVKNIYEH